MTRRIAYRLNRLGFQFRRARGKAAEGLGPWQIVDASGGVVAWGELYEQSAREYGLLKRGERFE